ncbi:MAG: hypothetical protein IBX56_14760 [Methylomicrobium sp.]|nr:hypothetical protein [Methylomicrobium sp.]
MEYYQTNKQAIVRNSVDGGVIPIGDRRQAIADFVGHPQMDNNDVVEPQLVVDESEPFMGPMDWVLVAMVFLIMAI